MKNKSAIITAIILTTIFGISIYIRAVLPHDATFINGTVWFRETDAYYYMRNIEVLVKHFPLYNSFDPYMLFPFGGVGLTRPFFAWLTAAVILILKGGSASLQAMQTITAYMPAVLGSLIIVPVYFIGKELWNKWAGIVATILVTILPGELLHRSLLGFSDHHVLEALFSTTAILFFIMAIKRSEHLTFGRLRNRNPVIYKPLIYTLLCGLFLGFLMLSWSGALLFVLIMLAYISIQTIINHLKGKRSDHLCIIGVISFLIGFLMLLPIMGSGRLDAMTRVAMTGAILAPIVLVVLSRVIKGKWAYIISLVGLFGIMLGVLHAINPILFSYMAGRLSVFTPSGAKLTIMEATGLLTPQAGVFTFQMAWANFTTSFFIAFISVGMLIRNLIKKERPAYTFFLIWCAVIFFAVLGQRRFGYYYTINVALLTGFFSWKILEKVGVGKTEPTIEPNAKAKKFKSRRQSQSPKPKWGIVIVSVLLFFVIIFPNTGLWRDQPTQIGNLYIGYTKPLCIQRPIMTKAWYQASLWLKDNTPEPFNTHNYYYQIYPSRGEFEYPETAYGVMSWWDYGYFIMQVGHRIPNANPGQSGAIWAGQFFTAQNETEANEIADEYGTKYVMIDGAMASGKFYAMVEWAGKNVSDFYDVFYAQTNQGGQYVTLFYPEFYQSMCIRLYNFKGEAVTPTQPIVISYQEEDGNKYITNGQQFATYEEAVAFMGNQTIPCFIVGVDPMISPVPLEALTSYAPIYPNEGNPQNVKIWEYNG